MYRLTVTTWINASTQCCFDLARSVDAHVESSKQTGERIVAGRRSGLLQLGDELTFEARHLGVRQRSSSKVTAFEPYSFFQDRMTRGAFRSMQHDHRFEPADGGTIMTDLLVFQAPFGPIGWIAERVVLARHLRHFLVGRGLSLKTIAESDRAAIFQSTGSRSI